MSRWQFTIRDWCWLCALFAVGIGWRLHYRDMSDMLVQADESRLRLCRDLVIEQQRALTLPTLMSGQIKRLEAENEQQRRKIANLQSEFYEILKGPRGNQ